MGVEFSVAAEKDLRSSSALAIVWEYQAYIGALEFELLELRKTGQIVRQNPLRYMH